MLKIIRDSTSLAAMGFVLLSNPCCSTQTPQAEEEHQLALQDKTRFLSVEEFPNGPEWQTDATMVQIQNRPDYSTDRKSKTGWQINASLDLVEEKLAQLKLAALNHGINI